MRSKPRKLIKPEKQVESEVLAWAFLNGFSLDVYDSKGSFSAAQGRYTENRGMKKGTSDLQGSSPGGYFCCIELKEPAKDKCCSIEQYHYLLAKLDHNAFAVVTSSAQDLSEKWFSWLKLRKEGKNLEAMEFLRSKLPKKVIVDGKVISLETHS